MEKVSLQSQRITFEYTSEWFAKFESAIPALPESVRAAVLKRRIEFSAGRWCAQEAMKKFAICETVAMGAQREPLWPEGLVGSISHSSGFAMATVGCAKRYAGIGVDAECILDTLRARELYKEFAVEGEWQHLVLSLPTHSTEAVLATLIFSAKESLYKCVYPRVKRILSFHDVRITAIDWEQGVFFHSWNLAELRMIKPLIAGHFHFEENERLITECLWPVS